ncbi:hypothetical protein FBD94_25625, partial [Pedobacter hiemivivus]
MMKYFFTFLVVLFLGLPSIFAQDGTSMFMATEIPVPYCGHVMYSDQKYTGYGSGFVNNYGFDSPDVWYRFTLNNATNVAISLCESDLDTYLYILDENGYLVASNDNDGPLCSGSRSSISQYFQSGTYYIVAEGYYNSVGNISLNFEIAQSGLPVTGSGRSTAIDVGSFGSSGGYTDTRSNADPCLNNNIGQQSNEIYYRFTLTQASQVTITNCGSNVDTYVYLLDASGVLIDSDGDNYETTPCLGKAYLKKTLAAGTYYLASEGYGSYTGDIATNIDVSQIQITPDPPAISYVSAPDFFVGTPISPLIPTNTGGAVSLVNQNTSTFAGSGSRGSLDGLGTSASFSYPTGTAVDGAGNVYVADTASHRIRKITPEGLVSTLAGSSQGYADGVRENARFNSPSAIAVDASGNVFVADQSNHRIRKITPSGTVTTFAGSGVEAEADGIGTSASFNGPRSLAFDASGNLYVSDLQRIHKITPTGVVTTFAIAGASTIAFDKIGNLFIAGGGYIRKISTSGVITPFCGGNLPGFSNGSSAESRFNSISGICVDNSGIVYVTDQLNNMIRRIDSLGNSSTFAGTTSPGSTDGTLGEQVRFDSPLGLCITPNGTMYVSEGEGKRIRKVMLVKGYSISPALPEGLVLNEIDGTINGTPLRSSEATVYTVTAYNSGGSSNTTVNLKVIGFCPEPSNNQNYVISYTPRVPQLTTIEAVVSSSCDPAKVQTSIQYLDGLGRPLQNVQIRGSAAADKDIVSPINYDALGRESLKYLPYASTTSNGSYKPDALTKVVAYYAAKPEGQESAFSTPYAETRFEASPLNRVLEQGAPGTAWQIGANNTGHTLKITYGTNLSNNVKLWVVNGSGATATYYEANTLYKTTSKDENWKVVDIKAGTVDEYKDLEGQIVLKRVWETDVKCLSTYYLYDDFGNLRYVLPPAVNEGTDRLSGALNSFTEEDIEFKNFMYGYHYDDRNRLVEKKIPGKDWEFIVYNALDQVILTQDWKQRMAGKWLSTKYDALGRVILTGLYDDGRTRPLVQAAVDDLTLVNPDYCWSEEKSGSGIGYTSNVFPQSISYYHSLNYYGDYSFPGNVFGQPNATLGQAQASGTKGLLTASSTTVLGTGNMLLTVNYYDAEGRLIQSKAEHYKNNTAEANNYDQLSNVYGFTGELKESTRRHFNNNTEALYVYNKYQYDHMGRKLSTEQKTATNLSAGEALSFVKLSADSYNEVGLLKQIGLHNSLQHTNLYYNARGWLSKRESDEFSLQLKYEDGTEPQYNGNIANQGWGAGSIYANLFTYQYDKLNRLENGTGAGMTEVLTYDVMGNIKSLNRDAAGANTYHYIGNQLNSVDNMTGTYVHNENGNATYDGRTQATIDYNYLNLPSTVSLPGSSLTYLYDASGRKLRKISSFAGTVDYIDGIHYKPDGSIDFVLTEVGLARRNGTDYNYEYTLADHLGNARYSFDISGGGVRRVQQQDYYPFGMIKESGKYLFGEKNKYLYNGKELQEELDGQLDYGARFYDPVIGRWTTVDPSADEADQESFSPYSYVFNNPVKNTDPDGRIPNIDPPSAKTVIKGAAITTGGVAGGIFAASLATGGIVAAGGTATIVGAP